MNLERLKSSLHPHGRAVVIIGDEMCSEIEKQWIANGVCREIPDNEVKEVEKKMRNESEVRAKLSEIESRMEELTNLIGATEDITKAVPFISELSDLMMIRRVLKWVLAEVSNLGNRKVLLKDWEEWFEKE